jgi:hypothetical protein
MRDQGHLNGRLRTSIPGREILPQPRVLLYVIVIEKRAIGPMIAHKLSFQSCESSVTIVGRMVTSQMSAFKTNHLFLSFSLREDIKELLVEIKELLGETLAKGGQYLEKGPQNATIRPGGTNPYVRAQVVVLNREDSNTSAIVEGTILIIGNEAKVLIDPGSTHSFITTPFTGALKFNDKTMPWDVLVSTPLGKQLGSTVRYTDYELGVGNVVLTGDLISLPIDDYYAIVDWYD